MDEEPEDQPFRWPGPLPAPDFVMVPKLVHREILKHLSGAEFKVFYALLVRAYEWGQGDAELSTAEIAELTGTSKRMTIYAIQKLVEHNLVQVFAHHSKQHGHEANTYRVMVTDDPRYVDRTPSAKIALASSTIAPGSATTAQDRARDPYQRKKKDQEPPTPTDEKYSRGLYAVCPTCGCRPHAPDCPEVS